MSREYFSARQGRGPAAEPMPFEDVRRLVVSVVDDFRGRYYLQEAFGYECVDKDAPVIGAVGADPDAYFLRLTGRSGIWPYWEADMGQVPPYDFGLEELPRVWEGWDEDTLFDVVEVLHDLVSKPLKGRHHSYANCGWHYQTFNRQKGQREFRKELNRVLELHDPPYVMDEEGQVLEATPSEFRPLLDADLPVGENADLIEGKVQDAITLFRSRGATIRDRQRAVRDLADALEPLRADINREMLSADENALFELANRFAIRHNNRDQRGDYDQSTWLRWAFYVYLATIHAVMRVRDSQQDA